MNLQRPWAIVIFIVLGLLLTILGPSLKAKTLSKVYIAKLKVVAILNKDDQRSSFSFPSALGYDSSQDEIYVIDSSKGRIAIFTSDFFPIFSFGKGRGVYKPQAITIDKKGNIYICQAPLLPNKKARISIFNAAAIKIKDLSLKGFPGANNFYPVSIAIGKNGHIYVAGLNFTGLVVLDSQGNFLKIIAPKDRINPNTIEKKARIRDVFVDFKGRLYLLSEEMGRFYVYDNQERFLFKGGKKGGSEGKLSHPRGICADPRRGLIYVIDYMRHSGEAFDYYTGRFRFEFGGRGWGPGWFNYPTDIMVDRFGRIYVADLFNRRVQVLEIIGKESKLPVNPMPSFMAPIK